MKIVSWNVNGIRAIEKKDFIKNFKKINADIFCLQEVRASEKQISEKIKNIKGYTFFLNSAEKKGYSGVAVLSKEKPLKIEKKIGFKDFDKQGRILILYFKEFILINIYFPHGNRDKRDLKYKLLSYKKVKNFLKKNNNKKIIIAGDFNIAHTNLDLKNFKQNKNNVMFTAEERNTINKLMMIGMIDTFRYLHTNKRKYSWWSYLYNSREKNIGWRIDYILVSKKLLTRLTNAFILNNFYGSDHCPVGIELK